MDGDDVMLRQLAEHDPLLAVAWGLPLTRLPSMDPDWWAARLALWDVAAGSSDPLLAAVADAEVAWLEQEEHLRCVHATIDSPLFAVRQCLDELPLVDEEDVAVYVGVLSTIPVSLRGLEQTLRKGIAEHKTAARRQAIATTAAAREWSAAVLTERITSHLRASLPAGLALDFDRQAAAAADAFAGIASFLTSEYLPHARAEDVVGPDTYDLWARRYFLESPRRDWYGWAIDELDKVTDELQSARRAIEAAGPSLRVAGSAAHRDWCEQFVATAASATVALVPLPRGDSVPAVQLMPAGGIGSYSAYYSPPKETEAGPGTVWIAPGDGPHYVEYEKVLLAHEGVPGHHAETVHQRRAPSLTPFQRVVYLPVHSEGWGLYAEALADEVGLYDTPHSRAGYLGSLALRIASLVIDMGLHCGLPRSDGAAWTIAAAAELLHDVGLDEGAATSWIDNILGRPGHRSTYAVGKLGWTEARRAAVAAGVDASTFHVAALQAGPCTFEVMRNLTVS